MTTLASPVHHKSHADRERILRYYRIVQPLMLQHFGGTPMVYAAYPRGLENYVVYHGALRAKPPGNLRTIEVLTGAHLRRVLAARDELDARAHERGRVPRLGLYRERRGPRALRAHSSGTRSA